MKNEKLQAILKDALTNIKNALAIDEINELRNRYMGKKSELASMGSVIGTLPPEEKRRTHSITAWYKEENVTMFAGTNQ